MHARPSGATEDSPENRLNYWWRTPLNPNHRRRQSLWGAFDRAYHLGSLCGLGFARATFSVTPANRLPHAHHLAFPHQAKRLQSIQFSRILPGRCQFQTGNRLACHQSSNPRRYVFTQDLSHRFIQNQRAQIHFSQGPISAKRG